MKKLLVSAVLISASLPVYAQNKATPFGIDLGTDTCADIYQAKQGVWSLQEPSMSVWSGGTILTSNYPGIVGFENGRDFFIICDSDDKSIVVSLTIPKNSVPHVANQLDQKYKLVQRNLPQLGAGRAVWKADNANIEIDYVHVSFNATLTYQNDKAKSLYSQFQREEAQRKREETAGQL